MSKLANSKSPAPKTAGMFNLGAARIPSPSPARIPSPSPARISSSANPLKMGDQNRSGIIPGARPRPTGGRAKSPKPETKPEEDKAIVAHNPRMTDEEIKNLLVGYVVLPKKYWLSGLAYRQHIRYIRLKDDIFVRGGFISGIGKQRGKDTLSMVNCFNPQKSGYYAWVIALEAIKTVFVRRADWDEIRKVAEPRPAGV